MYPIQRTRLRPARPRATAAAPNPAPGDVLAEIGLVLAAALAVALIANLVALALGAS